jgi:hypothetical protein
LERTVESVSSPPLAAPCCNPHVQYVEAEAEAEAEADAGDRRQHGGRRQEAGDRSWSRNLNLNLNLTIGLVPRLFFCRHNTHAQTSCCSFAPVPCSSRSCSPVLYNCWQRRMTRQEQRDGEQETRKGRRTRPRGSAHLANSAPGASSIVMSWICICFAFASGKGIAGLEAHMSPTLSLQ